MALPQCECPAIHGFREGQRSSDLNSATNQIASGNGVTYDAVGDIINDGIHSYTYDAEGRITQVDGGSTATYQYDAFGRRTRRTVNGVGYEDVYDPSGKMVTEVQTSGLTVKRQEIYTPGRHLATYTNGATYFSHTDWTGSERVRSASDGTSAGTCTGNPYGDHYSCTGTDPSPIKYAGMEYDGETQLNHTLFRYYNPRLGLWMTPDPAGASVADLTDPQSLNRYAYVANNPINRVDPSGLRAQPHPLCPLSEDIDPFNACWDSFGFDGGGFGEFGGIGGFDSFDCLLPGECGGLPSGLSIPPLTLGDLLGIPQGNPTCDFGPCSNPIGNGFSGNNGTAGLSPEQQCVADFYNTKFGKLVQFTAPTSLLPGWNPAAGANAREWATTILSKGTGIFATGVTSGTHELTTLTGTKVVGSALELNTLKVLTFFEKLAPPVAGIASIFDGGAHLNCHIMSSCDLD